ncbi:MAG TPA: hypothetical protein VGX70_03245 [Gemmataceae bacterium]|nr:hypothetical protein [Gemmataceae bacterium]
MHQSKTPRIGLIVVMAIGMAAMTPSLATEKGKVTVEKIEYKGWKNNLRLSNGDAELILTLDVGPRVISYKLAGGKNVFVELADQMGKSGESEWVARGGHRLWVGPEDLTRTYAPDNNPIKYEELPGGAIRLIQNPDEYGIQKEMDVQLAASGPKVTVTHRIKNVAEKEAELAPWALTMMAPGGVEIIPLPVKSPHPGPPKNAKSPKDYWPNQIMVVWPFTDFKDPRWNFGSKYITLRHDANRGPTKIGLAHQLGWIGYLNERTLFIKRIPYEEGKTYPDNGCNFETFSNQDMQEIESLGPMKKLAPGKSVEHVETWELVGNVDNFQSENGIDSNVLPKIK